MKPVHAPRAILMTLLVALAATHSRAEIAIHEDQINLFGYAAGSVNQVWQLGRCGEPNSDDATVAVDAARLGLSFNYMPVTAKLSAYVPGTDGNASNDIYLLDASVTYNFISGSKLTFGRFQSWIGYEAFDMPARHFITPGTTAWLSIIPTFQEGVRYELTSGDYTYGIAIVDSVYPVKTPYSGDSDLSNGYGVEGRVAYTNGNLSATAALGYQQQRDDNDTDTWVVDVHGEYYFPGTETTIGGEICVKTFAPMAFDSNGIALINNRVTTYFGLLTMRQKMSEKVSLNFRVSAGHEKAKLYKGQRMYDDGAPVYHGGTTVLFSKYSTAFNYAYHKNLDLRGEFSWTIFKNTRQGAGEIKGEAFLGVQAVLKF